VPILKRLLAFGYAYFLFGAFMLAHNVYDRYTYAAILDHGAEATARLVDIRHNAGAPGGKPYYVVDLAWSDKSGGPRTYKASVSLAFASSIIAGGRVVNPNIKLKFLESQSWARPLIVGDDANRIELMENNLKWGAGFFASSVLALAILYVARAKYLAR
jgi:hypothetical protein